MSLKLINKDIKLQIAEPPIETPRSDDEPSKQVIIGILHRGEQRIPAEGSLNISKTCVVWEINEIGTYYVSLDNLDIDKTEGLSPEETEMLQFWTNHHGMRLLEG
jgi:hypothetical protein